MKGSTRRRVIARPLRTPTTPPMVAYGSDYLLGTAGCAPDAFAARDRLWRAGEPRAFALNDVLQYLGTLLHRAPLAGARHAALQWLHARGLVRDAAPWAGAERRPETDVPLYRDIAARLDALLAAPIDAPEAAPRASAVPAL